MADAHADALTILPLGGLGAIGMNCMLIGTNDDLILIDCGAMMPSAAEPGVHYILPSMAALDAHLPKLRAVIITHGHEDHIGALPWLLRRCDVPVYAPRFAMGLIDGKLSDAKLNHCVRRLISPQSTVQIGAMALRFVRVTHSIPDALAVVIDAPAGRVVHTGDFRLDPEPISGELTDEATLRRLGDEGVLLLMSDSTNATVPGHTRAEVDVAESIGAVFREAKGRVLVGMFSSNIERSLNVIRAARAAGRRVAVIGRSMHRYMDIARSHTELNDGGVLDGERLARTHLEADDMVLLCTGSQGEARGALRRIASGQHNSVRMRNGDTLLLSARAIPGNDVEIYKMTDDYARAGVRVLHAGNRAGIHGSGHAAAEELRTMLRWLRPKFFVPVHGTFGFMTRHAELAAEVGDARTLVVENGQRLSLSADDLRVDGEVDCAPWYAMGRLAGSAQELVIRERTDLSHNGVVSALATHHAAGWRVQVRCHGVALAPDEDCATLAEVAELALGRRRLNDHDVAELVRSTLRKYVKHGSGQRPVVHTFVHRGRESQ